MGKETRFLVVGGDVFQSGWILNTPKIRVSGLLVGILHFVQDDNWGIRLVTGMDVGMVGKETRFWVMGDEVF